MRKPLKQTYRALFLALQADAKEYPGGISAIAKAMGMNGNTLANGINPDHDALPPSFAAIVEIISVTQARRTVFVLAQVVGQMTVDAQGEGSETPGEAISLFLSLVGRASELLGKGSEAAKDGRFDADERRLLEPLLVSLMQAVIDLLQAVRGGA